jgi:hypothetical protein
MKLNREYEFIIEMVSDCELGDRRYSEKTEGRKSRDIVSFISLYLCQHLERV